ncbi:hypothetical protein K431DRAFT_224202 [Polychaeton citri CBS 116435]|uniref:Efficient mitochondria targeting-associated protein 19 n=1 Tax=Polychaeton citri CBS 116435 TaxID=1314669 RepID=A0A9P4Q6G0_9PEZI|nr:hypothetical protein K431DRAFT_224202 [Polychaeton citri CBS 116435]
MASIMNRRRDLLYLLFFLIHLPVIFCVDITPLYPTHLKPQFMTDLRQWYISIYRDRFFISPPAWFEMYMYLELLYHVPVSVWAIKALLRDDPKVPIQLLVFAVQTAVTTSTCIADYMSWGGYSSVEKLELGKLYVPYLGLAVFMGVDMLSRLTNSVGVLKNGQGRLANKKVQ